MVKILDDYIAEVKAAQNTKDIDSITTAAVHDLIFTHWCELMDIAEEKIAEFTEVQS